MGADSGPLGLGHSEYSFTAEDFASLAPAWAGLQARSAANHVFATSEWLQVWLRQFGAGLESLLGAVRQGGRLVGIAPLVRMGETASFIGNANVCDYLDFVVEKGQEEPFFSTWLDSLPAMGITRVELAPVRPDSTVIKGLTLVAPAKGWQVCLEDDEVSPAMDLPDSWDAYLGRLEAKQRHELERKLRKLAKEGDLRHRAETGAGHIGTFLRLFRDSRRDKADFLTPGMEAFFRALADGLSAMGWLRWGILELNGVPVAMTMCFDFNSVVYLYNSGYDPAYASLNAGLVSKALCIRDSIEMGRRRFDFLKGDEDYKYRLGGINVPLYRCTLVRQPAQGREQ